MNVIGYVIDISKVFKPKDWRLRPNENILQVTEAPSESVGS
jgi:hypothetical protein